MTATHDDIYKRLGRGEERFHAVENQLEESARVQKNICEKLDRVIAAQDQFRTEIGDIRHDIKDISEDVLKTRDVVETFSTVKNLGRFLKWFSGILAASALILGVLKIGFINTLKAMTP